MLANILHYILKDMAKSLLRKETKDKKALPCESREWELGRISTTKKDQRDQRVKK